MASKKFTKKRIIGGLIVIAVIVAVVVNLGDSSDGLTLVQADLAYRDDISEMVTASGRIQPQTSVDIVAEVSAEIIQVFANEGDRVSRGNLLLLLDTVQAKSDVQQSRFSLDELTARAQAARTQRDKDKLEFERQQRLFDQKLTSETAFTDARFAYESATANYDAVLAQVKTGQAILDKAEDNLAKTKILSPMDGVVTYVSAEAGEIAQAQTSFTQGQTLMTIADLSVFEVEVDVDETEIAKVKLDQTADIRVDAFRDTAFAGRVVEIGNSAKISGQGTDNYMTSFYVKVRFVDTVPSIRPGMSATVDIEVASDKDALLIPYAAVVTREFDEQDETKTDEQLDGTLTSAGADDEDGSAARKSGKAKKIKKSGVFLCENGQARFVEITTGIADERNIVALSGVSPGDTVISGSFKTLRELTDSTMVEIDQRSKDQMAELD
ncbi:efflux RND transporter periplasmic adaptor subunit [bacterium]|nr:efflux RND transporter periplasmic adaptor subunit [bacterium]